MNIRERLFLISGGNFFQRQQVINGIKKRLVKSSDYSLSIFTFYGKEVDLKDLGHKLLTAALNQKKAVIFKDFHQLASTARKLIFKNLNKILTINYLIFDSDREYYRLQRDKKFTSDELFAFILKRAATYRVSSAKKDFSIQDLMSGLRKNDLAACLYVVESLFCS